MPRYRITAEVVFDAGADTRAIGGAVTVALCGHWEHEGECRWPHYNHLEHHAETQQLTVEFTCPENDLDEVVGRIRQAVANGVQCGPDGREHHWRQLHELSPAVMIN